MDPGYVVGHQNRTNMLIHIVAVPTFILGALLAVGGAVGARWIGLIIGVVLLATSLAAQGVGHKYEQVPPKKFDGPLDFVKRIGREQFYTFPKYVLTGGWLKVVKP
jgi:hypothetical protein